MYKVLVVEDEELIRKGLVYAYDWAAANCVVAGEADNGLAGVDQIRELQPDIVVTDVNMPLMDGLAMLEKTIEDYQYAAVIISGYDEFSLAQTAIRLGVNEYLLKPIDFSDLSLALERAKQQYEQRKMYREAQQKGRELQNPDLLAHAHLGSIASRRVRLALEYLHEHYTEKITVYDTAEQLGISISYLSQKFKSETSYTFNDYLNRYRIMMAIRLLHQGDKKVYAIAEEVGFSDYKYFISVFKKYTGVSPGRFLGGGA